MRALAIAVVLSSLSVSTARAQCPGGSVFSLSSGGWTWEFDAGGAVIDGNGAYDGLYRLYIDGTEFNGGAVGPMPEAGGRGVRFQQILATGGVATGGVERHILVPAGESYARWIDIITNITAMERTYTIELRTNSGYDMDQEVVSSSSGNTALEAADRWFVLDDALVDPLPDPPFTMEETPPPASCFVVAGMDAPSAPTSITASGGACPTGFPIMSTEGATVRFSLTLPAASTVSLMYFAALGTLRADASAVCAMLAPLPTSVYADVDMRDRSRIQNWVLALPVASPCSTDSQCVSGHCEDDVCCMTACGGSTADCEACSGDAGSTMPDGTCGIVRSTASCRAAASACDLPERCDGTSRTCPPDAVRAAGYLCRPDRGTCDVPDFCDGTSPGCPADAVEPAGTVCDALGMLDCWTDGTCTGTDPACPTARMLPDRWACDDGMTCTESWCMSGACLSAGAGCDDRDPCTTDSCNASMTCDHAAMPGCDGGIPPAPTDAGPPEFKDVGEADASVGDEDVGAGDMDAGPDFDAGGRMDARVRRDGDPLTTEDLTVGGGGCVCRAAGGRASPTIALAALAWLLALSRRRSARAERGR